MARGCLTIRLCGRAGVNESVPAASGPEPRRARLDRGSSGQAPARQASPCKSPCHDGPHCGPGFGGCPAARIRWLRPCVAARLRCAVQRRTEPADGQDPTGFPQTHIRAVRMSRGRGRQGRSQSTAGCRTRRPGRAAYRPDRVPAAPAAGPARSRCSRAAGSEPPRFAFWRHRTRVEAEPAEARAAVLQAGSPSAIGGLEGNMRRPHPAGPVRRGACRCAAESRAQHGGDGVEFESGTQVGKGLGFDASARGGGSEPTRRRDTMQVVTGLGRSVRMCPLTMIGDSMKCRPRQGRARPT